LADLAAHRGEEVTASEVARRQGITIPDAARQLARLEEAGLLRSHRRGRLRLYAVDESLPLWPELRRLLLKTTGAAALLAEALENLPVQAAFLFGSVAAGTDAASSDLDLLVVGPLGLKDLSPALDEAEATLGREVNAVVYTPEELRRALAGGDPFLNAVMRGPRVFLRGDENDLRGLAAHAADTAA
jgi:predicted nucleotidyltransferase